MSLIAVDPSKATAWWAYFNQGHRLEKCGRLKMKSAHHAATFFSQFKGQTLAIELPMIKRGGRFGQVDPQDIIDLAVRVGWIEAAPWLDVVEYKPNQWKGQTPKKVSNDRTWNKLSHSERAVVDSAKVPQSLLNNLLDAVGIGIYHLRARGLRE